MAHKQLRLPLWIDDFEAHLFRTKEPTLAVGARVLLWCRAARNNGTLPNDEAKLMKWAHLNRRQWAQVRDYLLSSWRLDEDENVFVVRRVRAELVRTSCKSESSRASARVRWGNRQDLNPSKQTTGPMRTHSERIPVSNASPSHPIPSHPNACPTDSSTTPNPTRNPFVQGRRPELERECQSLVVELAKLTGEDPIEVMARATTYEGCKGVRTNPATLSDSRLAATIQDLKSDLTIERKRHGNQEPPRDNGRDGPPTPAD